MPYPSLSQLKGKILLRVVIFIFLKKNFKFHYSKFFQCQKPKKIKTEDTNQEIKPRDIKKSSSFEDEDYEDNDEQEEEDEVFFNIQKYNKN